MTNQYNFCKTKNVPQILHAIKKAAIEMRKEIQLNLFVVVHYIFVRWTLICFDATDAVIYDL